MHYFHTKVKKQKEERVCLLVEMLKNVKAFGEAAVSIGKDYIPLESLQKAAEIM